MPNPYEQGGQGGCGVINSLLLNPHKSDRITLSNPGREQAKFLLTNSCSRPRR